MLAALSPAAYSMLADLFPRERLGRAIGIYSSGVFVGIGLSFIIGGPIPGIENIMESEGFDTEDAILLGSIVPLSVVVGRLAGGYPFRGQLDQRRQRTADGAGVDHADVGIGKLERRHLRRAHRPADL